MTVVPPSQLLDRRKTSSEHINRSLVVLIAVAILALGLACQWPLSANLSSPGVVLAGVYDLEGRASGAPFRWTNGDAHISFLGIGRQSYRVTMTLSSARPADLELPAVTLLANGVQIGAFTAPRPQRDSTFEIPAGLLGLSGDLDLNLKSGTFAPPNDLRTLGVALYALRIEPAGPPPAPVLPAPLPLAWAVLSAAFTFLAATARFPRPAAWALSLALIALLTLGLALQRLQTTALLPWALLLSILLFIASRRSHPTESSPP